MTRDDHHTKERKELTGPRLERRVQAEPHNWPHPLRHLLTEGTHGHANLCRVLKPREEFGYQEILIPRPTRSPCFMGPRKRSKPNPEAETQLVSGEAPLPQGPLLPTKDSSKPAVGKSVPSNGPEGVEPDQSSVNGGNTVSAEAGQLVQNEANIV